MFCAYTRPRYQVSVYRTIGTLVFLFLLHNIDCGYSLEMRNEVVLTCTHDLCFANKENTTNKKLRARGQYYWSNFPLYRQFP